MKKKIIGILMCSMLITTAMPVANVMAATTGLQQMVEDDDRSVKYREMGEATVINCSSLTVHSSSSNSSSAVGWVQKGAKVTVCDSPGGSAGWTFIGFFKTDGTYTYGYVGSSYLTPKYY